MASIPINRDHGANASPLRLNRLKHLIFQAFSRTPLELRAGFLLWKRARFKV
jgi:hypothetical protein